MFLADFFLFNCDYLQGITVQLNEKLQFEISRDDIT